MFKGTDRGDVFRTPINVVTNKNLKQGECLKFAMKFFC